MQQGGILSEFGSVPFLTSFIGYIGPPLMIVIIDGVGQLLAGYCTFGEHNFVCHLIVIAVKCFLVLDELFTAVICCTIVCEIDWVEVTKSAQLTEES